MLKPSTETLRAFRELLSELSVRLSARLKLESGLRCTVAGDGRDKPVRRAVGDARAESTLSSSSDFTKIPSYVFCVDSFLVPSFAEIVRNSAS